MMPSRPRVSRLFLLLPLLLLGACNTLRSTDDPSLQSSNDSWQGMNRSIYNFNSSVDKAILKPVAKGYDKTVPKPAKKGISNFFNNLSEPLNMVNNLLQGKFDRFLSSTYRFTVNSTVGLFGLFDVADNSYQVTEADEDLGQTLAAWGVKPGPYVMLPFLGPSNLRDTVGFFGQSAVYYPNEAVTDSAAAATALTILDVIDTRAGLLGVDEVLDQQLDPYLFLKTAYEQDRLNDLYDGKPPQVNEEDFDF